MSRALLSFYEALGAHPEYVTFWPPKAGAYVFSAKRITGALLDERARNLFLSSKEANVAGGFHLPHVRADPKVAEFDRRWGGVIVHGSLDVRALWPLAAEMDARFGLISGGMASHARRADAAREAYGGGDREKCDPALVERVEWDAWKWRRSHTKLLRLYPITIIGPEIWAQLPPMPAFDPMPVVEDLGHGKLLTAWPTLCPPRDPAFLRGTRALRAWLWPYTIQNPADHVDNDPPAAA